MEKIIYAYWCCYDWQTTEEGRLEVYTSPRDYALEDYTLLGEFTINVPDFAAPSQVEVNANRTKYLKIAKDDIQSKAFLDAKKIEEKIQNLLALPAEV